MNLGLLGCGNIAYWFHLRALRRLAGCTFVAAADPDAAARERARRLTRAPVYERSDELLGRKDIDAVVISAPTHLHAELAVAAATAGKHFYLEKPLAITATGAGRVLDAAARAGVVGAIGFNRRLHPLYEQARALLKRGGIGPVRAVQTAFSEPSPLESTPNWKRQRATGGGVLLDLGSHHFDQLRWFLGEEFAGIEASIRSESTEQDSARVELEMRSGIEVQSWFSFRTALTDYLEFIGERGTLRVDRHAPALRLRHGRRFGYGLRVRSVAPSLPVAAWRLRRLARPSSDPSYARSLRAFVDLVHGRPSGSATLLDGLRSLEAVLAAEESDRRGERVRLETDRATVSCGFC
jgi:predicted dehydrogenase